MPQSLKQRLIETALNAGAQKTGFATVSKVEPGVWQQFSSWLKNGNNASMNYLANYPDIRQNPALLLENSVARTVIVCAFSYYHPEQQAADAAKFAMYAHGNDYHEVLRERLQPLRQLLEECGYSARICIDSAPVLERYWAVKAGIGFIGQNKLLIVPQMGSYFFLAEIITDAPITPDDACTLTCGNCNKCINACPGGALRNADGFDSSRCISYLTIEHRGDLPATLPDRNGNPKPLYEILGNRVYGCDVCQQVCPHNSNPPVTTINEFRLRPALSSITKADIEAMTQPEFSAIFSHSAVKRAKLAGLRRNANRSRQ